MIDARLKVRLLWTIFHHEIMYKTRNLFRANGSKRVPGFCLDGMHGGARGFFIFWYILPCRARRGRSIPSG